jgi:hypothetical protein
MFKLIFCASFLVSPGALLLRDHLIKRVRECGTMEEDNNFFEFDSAKSCSWRGFSKSNDLLYAWKAIPPAS